MAISKIGSDGLNQAADTILCADSGNVGIGTSSPSVKLDVVGSTTSGLRLRSSSGASNGFNIYNDSGTDTASLINFYSGPMVFGTGNTERVRILSSGGITFNGDTAAANALDDYEEGTFTPALEIGGSTSGITYSEQLGLYVKIGTFCYVQITITLSSKGSNSGVLTFNNLPFLSDNTAGARGGGTVNFFGQMSGVNGAPTVYGEQGTYRTGLYDAGNSIVALSQMDNTNLTNSTYMRLTYVYQTNS